MRRKQCEINDKEEIKQILERVRVGRLGTLGEDGYPYITPVNYVFHRGSIYFHCAHKGEKTDNIKRCDKVCFEVDIPLSYLGADYDRSRPSCHVHQFYHSVIIRGRAGVVEDIEEKTDALNALVRVHEEGGTFTAITAETKEVGFCTVIAIRIDSITAKSDLAQKKDALEKTRIARYLYTRNLPGDREAARYIGEK